MVSGDEKMGRRERGLAAVRTVEREEEEVWKVKSETVVVVSPAMGFGGGSGGRQVFRRKKRRLRVTPLFSGVVAGGRLVGNNGGREREGLTGGVSPGKTRAWWLGSGRLERKRGEEGKLAAGEGEKWMKVVWFWGVCEVNKEDSLGFNIYPQIKIDEWLGFNP
ncbi:hypothetical protein HAX54_017166 [Datura stramonium]|uniref:Uncharacterized protein n=1 Tax=Datura stramonium TaxID=4076 RepID=A0ABS8UMH2_DATST|nr:hypothetical protein [Datura stramonium]